MSTKAILKWTGKILFFSHAGSLLDLLIIPNICNHLGWMELKSRKEFLWIIQLFKFINGFSRVKLDNYLSFSRATTISRNSKNIWKPFSRTNIILKFSFWHRYIDQWNSLPDSLICADSLSKFKMGLRDHFFIST